MPCLYCWIDLVVVIAFWLRGWWFGGYITCCWVLLVGRGFIVVVVDLSVGFVGVSCYVVSFALLSMLMFVCCFGRVALVVCWVWWF